ncbi:MAG: hypothetical protein KBT10_00150 [Bacteroidales bacterium]|nr:hypothetical protein [Candidatus Sodaliphilus aphodohippi]
MKKILFLAAMLLGTVATYAQSDDYIPLVREGSEWCYTNGSNGNYDKHLLVFSIEGDTIAYGRTYKILYANPKTAKTVSCLVREEDKKVYSVELSVVFRHGGIPVDTLSDGNVEYLMYDFNDLDEYVRELHALYGFDTSKVDSYATLSADDNVLVNRNCYQLNGEYSCYKVTEGVGLYGNYYGMVFSRALVGSWIRAGSPYRMIYMKNPQGDFEYLDRTLYQDVFGNLPSAVNDVTVTKPTDDSYYNLMGQPVKHPEDAPGIYIHEGKKVVVK